MFLRWLPVLTVLLVAVTFCLTYGMAVALDHVYPYWPYISDTGTLAPESCLFGQLLNIASALFGAIIYVRYLQVSTFIQDRPYVRITPLRNKITTCIGFLSVLGLDVVANFQETNLFLVHIIGAICCFSISTVYFLIQCIYTYRMKYVSHIIFWIRVVSTVFNAIFFVTVFAPIGKALENFKGDVMHWKPSDKGYGFHLTSTISEWLLVVSFSIYISTFFWEFRNLELIGPRLKFLDYRLDAGPKRNAKEAEEEVTGTCAASQWL